MPHAVITALREQQGRLLTVVEAWARVLRDNARKTPDPNSARAPLILPLAKTRQLLKSEPIDLLQVFAAFPQVFQRLGLADDKKKIDPHLVHILIEMVGVNAALQARLSEIACESASHRVLLVPQDSLDVTSFSILIAAAFANLGLLVEDVARRPRELTQAEQELVLKPLQWAESRLETLRPGDLWIIDLLGRSTAHALKRARQQEKSVSELLTAVNLRCFKWSLLGKLLDSNRLDKSFAIDANYQSWPGLAMLLAAKGAGSLQSVVCGELAQVLHHDAADAATFGFFRFLEALMGLQNSLRIIIGQRLIAQLLCELFALDENMLTKLRKDTKASQPLLRAIAWIEWGAVASAAPDNAKEEFVRLRISRDCLQTYESYRNLADLYAVRNPFARTTSSAPANKTADQAAGA